MGNKLSIYVLIDALGWDIIEGRSFLDDIIKTKVPVDTLLGYSSGIIPSILTGKMPNEHGQWNLFYFSQNGSPFKWLKLFRGVPEFLLENRYSRKVLDEILKNYNGVNSKSFGVCNVPLNCLPYFDVCEKGCIYEPGGIPKAESIFDILKRYRISYGCYTNYKFLDDSKIIEAATGDVEGAKYKLMFLYLADLDLFLHQHCKEKEAVKEKIDWYEDKIRELYVTALRYYDKVSISIFSDHGMTPTIGTYNLIAEIEKLKLFVGIDYLAMYDATMARFWLFSERARRDIPLALKQVQGTNFGEILSTDTLKSLGIHFENDIYGNLIFLMKPGWLIVPSFMSRKSFNGMHGFHPSDPSTQAIFLSNESGVSPKRVTDFFNTMLEGVRRIANEEGSQERVCGCI